MQRFRLEYDSGFGIEKKSGWSVCIDGSYYMAFDKNVVRAVVVALWRWWKESKGAAGEDEAEAQNG